MHGSPIHALLQSLTVAQIGAPVHPFMRSQNCPAAHAVAFTTCTQVPSALHVSSVHATLSLQSAGTQDTIPDDVDDEFVAVGGEVVELEVGALVVVLAPPTFVAAPVPAVEEASSHAPAWISRATSAIAVPPEAKNFDEVFTSDLRTRQARP